jgi:hypothetical protein
MALAMIEFWRPQLLLEFEGLKDKASNGNYEKFIRVISKVAAVEPPDYDCL